MRKLTRFLSLVLALLCLLATASAVADTGVVVGLSLEKIGEFAAPSTDELPGDDLPLGERAKYLNVSGIQYLEDGFYAVTGHVDDGIRIGLFDEDGKQLLPYEAALIKRMSARYLSVYYVTEKTTDKSEALLYAPSGDFWMIGDGIPKDGDTLFKGYVKFYDTARKCFVDNLAAFKNYASSGRLLKLDEYGDLAAGIYDENGALVTDEHMTVGSGYLRKDKEVYDEDLNLRYTSETQLNDFTSDGAYIQQALDNSSNGPKGYRCQVIDIDGNVILPSPFQKVDRECDGVFAVEKKDGPYALISADNTEIATSLDRFKLINPGYWCGKDDNGYLLVGPNGIVATGLEKQPENLQVYQTQPNGDTQMLVLNSGEWMAVPFTSANGLADGLIYKRFVEGEKCSIAVYNLYSGEIVLELEGSYNSVRIYSKGNFITAQRGDVCEVYRLRYEFK